MYKSVVTTLVYLLANPVNADDTLWRPDQNAKAYCENINKTICTVFVEGVSTDVSAIESKNIGKLGISPKAYYEKVITYPSKWLSSRDGNLIEFTTQAWSKGQRYTVKGMVFVNHQGEYVHQ